MSDEDKRTALKHFRWMIDQIESASVPTENQGFGISDAAPAHQGFTLQNKKTEGNSDGDDSDESSEEEKPRAKKVAKKTKDPNAPKRPMTGKCQPTEQRGVCLGVREGKLS